MWGEMERPTITVINMGEINIEKEQCIVCVRGVSGD